MITGICVSPGTAEGIIRIHQEGRVYTKEDIVILQRWLTHEVLNLKNAGALISTSGGITCHASIIARELKIPALVSADISSLREGQRVSVNTIEETIEVRA